MVRLRPAPHTRTPILSYSLTVTPPDHYASWQQDPFGNHLVRLVFPERADELSVVVDLIADMTVINPFDFFLDDDAERMPFAYEAGVASDLAPYLRTDAPGPLLAALLAELRPLRDATVGTDDDGTPLGPRTVDLLADVNRRIQGEVAYSIRMEPGVQDPDVTLRRAVGSCRDSAWLLVQVLRHLGLAARFASGYLVQLTADVAALDGPSGPTADFTDLHAWAEVFLPGAGWVGLDPTSGLFAGEGHIPLACTPEPSSAAPIAGATEAVEAEMTFSNVVTRVHEDPRVSRPYADAQWEAIRALGRSVDERLVAGDVRLTMGGEPTFVSIDDVEAPEWTTAADGPDKRRLAAALVDRLAARWAPGGIVQHGQGKWYPGEPLPRWHMGLVRRTDGEPLWLDPSLLAAPALEPGPFGTAEGGRDGLDAEGFARDLAVRLGLAPEAAIAGHEDTLLLLHAEVSQPVGPPPVDDLDPDDPALADMVGRAAVADALDRVARPTGWAIPLAPDPTQPVSDLAAPAVAAPPDVDGLGGSVPDGPEPASPPTPAPVPDRGWVARLLGHPRLERLARLRPRPAPSAVESTANRPRTAPDGAAGPGSTPPPAPAGQGATTRWVSRPWAFRRGRMVLLPGDSPMGLRLPLGSLLWTAPEGEPERSPFAPRAPLAPRAGRPSTLPTGPLGSRPVGPGPDDRTGGEPRPQPHPGPAADDPAEADEGAADPTPPTDPTAATVAEVAPTALCVEARDGRLHVFLPPLEHAEHLVDLLAAVEDTAAGRRQPVVLEGYPPPTDPRLTSLAVTPDPGVIEVNVAPSASWDELERTTVELAEEARLCRLGTETFMLDGTAAGTGGGNHLTLGGPTPADSPLLRRPDLVRSLVSYWQGHPSLSYLFSGRFVGPTSQAPRVDEGRDEALHELEIAFSEMDRLGPEVPPWTVDRLLRNLLVDVTGNTHRAELCIDKLFSPDSERGRLGLLEMRGFEMPPHPRMALVQALLVRALVARFWDEPHRAPLVRWGTRLHDRFLLPHWVEADIGEVVADVVAAGIAFDPAWIDPFLEMRFPRIGTTTAGPVTLELRAAIEPWNVLGEEATGGGTARYVDSSVERLQVAAAGVVPGRHVVTCNGVPVPLHATATADLTVAGVRYRAWSPPSALHPTIGIHGPLTFDVVDLARGRSLGGCRYHVVHPGGQGYERLPVNAMEAEARRARRFDVLGHTAGPVDVAALRPPAPGPAQDYPRTLDLRRVAGAGRMPPPA